MTMLYSYSRDLDQTCHSCGLKEAAGDHCSKCSARTVDDWHRVKFTEAQRAAMARTAWLPGERHQRATKRQAVA
jgi:methionyl-tRNA synthetase